ncbi:hypothetical protein [Streptomyces sp. NBC_00878]|uniref:hypothetical protein n=1 Tax=Streptomyces sp. NBC_00878 TaxID=2975854 RepID=UPI00225BAC02|nr:hypothetical protein [Streptomyces sp. NBC_00878]MCX4906425.1 hypothetical protein [Streptomyces sp. NBC_00878]
MTAAVAAIGMGGAFTAQASAGSSAPTPEKGKQVWLSYQCAELDPVDAVPGKGKLPKPTSYKDVKIDDKGPIDLGDGDVVDAVPGKGKLPKPTSYKDVKIDDKGPIDLGDGDSVEAELDKGEVTKPDSYADVYVDDKGGRIDVRSDGPIDAVPGDDECAEPGPGDDDPVEAVPGDSDDVAKPDSYGDAKVAPSKR